MYNHIITIFLLLAVACHTVCGNLLVNPTFNQAHHGWFSIGDGFTTKKDITTGNIGLFLTPAKEQTAGARQVVNVESYSPSIVTVSASSLIENAAGQLPTFQVVIVDMDGKKTTSSAQFDSKTGEWSTSSVMQIVPSVASIEVSLLASNEASVWFDDVAVTVVDYGFLPGQQQVVSNENGRHLRSVEAYESVSPATATMAATHAPATTQPPVHATATTQPPTHAPTTPAPTTAPTYTLGLKYLILSSSSSDIRLGVVSQTFDSVGAQYDIIYPANLNNASLSLTTSTGGKYLGVIFCTDSVGATAYQLAQIEAYLVQYSVKKVIFYTFPYTIYGVTTSTAKAASANNATLSFSSASSHFISGYNTSVQFPINGIWAYPATITNATIATPALTINYPGDTNQYVIAAFITASSGSRSLQFFLDQATWSPHSVGLGSFWLQWVSNNMYLGLRRIFFNSHLDDLFLASNTWDTELEVSSETIVYRINATELTNTALFINATNKALPAGSNFTISFPFNGQGIIDAGGYKKDPLFLAAKQPALMWTYVFEQHTYTHPELDNLTYAQTALELEKNLAETTIELFGSYNHPRYSNNSMVTPSISGIFNGNALKALWDKGIHHIVGDNSRPELASPFPYHGWYTNVTSNGFAGMHIVPREATYIYYDCSTAEQSEGEYNHIYLSYYGGYSTLQDIVTREGQRVTLLLLAFRYDPYMFHQANLREFWYSAGIPTTVSNTKRAGPTAKAQAAASSDSGSSDSQDPSGGQDGQCNGPHCTVTTLWAEWITAVISEYKKYLVLPMHGHNHQLLSQKWANREARDACGFTGSVTVNSNTKQIVSVQGSSTATCDIAITGVTPAQAQTKLSTETYGPDVTTYVNMRSDSFQFNLATPISLLQ